jgi:N utilization substance protein A
VLDEESERIEVVVPDEQLSLAIGRRGQNVRLASQLTGWDIDILTEAEESERRQKEFAERTQRFMTTLDVDEMLAQLLASEGFSSVEDVAFVATSELASLEGLDEDTATELQARARDYLDRHAAELDNQRRQLGVSDDLKDVNGVTPEMLVAFGQAGILTLEDLAGSATDELVGWTERKAGETVRHKGSLSDLGVASADAESIIMEARIKAGWIERQEPSEVVEPATGEA